MDQLILSDSKHLVLFCQKRKRQSKRWDNKEVKCYIWRESVKQSQRSIFLKFGPHIILRLLNNFHARQTIFTNLPALQCTAVIIQWQPQTIHVGCERRRRGAFITCLQKEPKIELRISNPFPKSRIWIFDCIIVQLIWMHTFTRISWFTPIGLLARNGNRRSGT